MDDERLDEIEEAVLRRLKGLLGGEEAGAVPEDWDEIRGFRSPDEFRRFQLWIAEAEHEGALREIPVGSSYGAQEERWYQAASGQIWRLVSLDFPATGVFLKVDPRLEVRSLALLEPDRYPDCRMQGPPFALSGKIHEFLRGLPGRTPRGDHDRARPDREFAAICALWEGLPEEFAGFPDRSPEDRNIQAMGYEEGVDDYGFRFQRTW